MTVREALAEMEYGLSQKRYTLSLLQCLGKAMQQDEVLLPNLDEAVLGVYELLNYLLERDETALDRALQATGSEAL